MKTIVSFLLIALLISSNGCMTYSAAQDAKGRQDQAVWMGHYGSDRDDKSHPGYYFLMPLTVPGDVAFSPIEGVWYLWIQMARGAGG
ncbi:MAG TPA: hypothetical protein VKJ65_11925 [Phycisphaerae bacterium]|nr:hypothetical protein [Phycisphaerae bacterium]